MGTKLNRPFTKEDIQMANKYMKKCSTSLAIREMQIKTTLRFHLTPSGMEIIRKTKTINAGEDVGEQEHFYTVGRIAN